MSLVSPGLRRLRRAPPVSGHVGLTKPQHTLVADARFRGEPVLAALGLEQGKHVVYLISQPPNPSIQGQQVRVTVSPKELRRWLDAPATGSWVEVGGKQDMGGVTVQDRVLTEYARAMLSPGPGVPADALRVMRSLGQESEVHRLVRAAEPAMNWRGETVSTAVVQTNQELAEGFALRLPEFVEHLRATLLKHGLFDSPGTRRDYLRALMDKRDVLELPPGAPTLYRNGRHHWGSLAQLRYELERTAINSDRGFDLVDVLARAVDERDATAWARAIEEVPTLPPEVRVASKLLAQVGAERVPESWRVRLQRAELEGPLGRAQAALKQVVTLAEEGSALRPEQVEPAFQGVLELWSRLRAFPEDAYRREVEGSLLTSAREALQALAKRPRVPSDEAFDAVMKTPIGVFELLSGRSHADWTETAHPAPATLARHVLSQLDAGPLVLGRLLRVPSALTAEERAEVARSVRQALGDKLPERLERLLQDFELNGAVTQALDALAATRANGTHAQVLAPFEAALEVARASAQSRPTLDALEEAFAKAVRALEAADAAAPERGEVLRPRVGEVPSRLLAELRGGAPAVRAGTLEEALSTGSERAVVELLAKARASAPASVRVFAEAQRANLSQAMALLFEDHLHGGRLLPTLRGLRRVEGSLLAGSASALSGRDVVDAFRSAAALARSVEAPSVRQMLESDLQAALRQLQRWEDSGRGLSYGREPQLLADRALFDRPYPVTEPGMFVEGEGLAQELARARFLGNERLLQDLLESRELQELEPSASASALREARLLLAPHGEVLPESMERLLENRAQAGRLEETLASLESLRGFFQSAVSTEVTEERVMGAFEEAQALFDAASAPRVKRELAAAVGRTYVALEAWAQGWGIEHPFGTRPGAITSALQALAPAGELTWWSRG